MKAVLVLERIGDDFFAYEKAVKQGKIERSASLDRKYLRYLLGDRKPIWVARITGTDPKFGFKREFQHGTRDYSSANSTGSRGIFEYFALDPGIYEVHERRTWRSTRRYFCRVIGTELQEIDKDEVERCLNAI